MEPTNHSTAVKTWCYEVQEYMALADVPENMQTRLAGTFLSGSAKTWFINTYADATPMPALNEVLKAFKEHHLAADTDADLIRRIETMCQGRRSVSEYATEYKMLVLELGENVDPQLDQYTLPSWFGPLRSYRPCTST
jgi:hypothetical protein